MVTIEVTVIIRQLHNQNSTNNIDQTNHATIIHFNWTNHMHECHPTIRNQEFMTHNCDIALLQLILQPKSWLLHHRR